MFKKSLRASATAKKCLSCEKGLIVQFCCDIDERLCSALGSRASDRGFNAGIGDQFPFFSCDRTFSDHARLGSEEKANLSSHIPPLLV